MSPSKFSGVILHEGDQVKILMPGGGGYGDPLERDRERVRRDVAEGFISEAAAIRDYGLIDGDGR
jgi:N-methylhydantoinase B